MASRVTVTVNVRDNSREGIRAAQNNIRRLNDDIRRAGGRARFNVRVNGDDARRDMQRLQRQLGGRTIRINTRADIDPPDSRHFGHTIRRVLGRQARGAGSFLGGLMSDGIGQGLANGVKAGGPIFAAALAAVIVGSLSLIGAALSGLLVTALGLAFVGIAGVSAATSKKVSEHWAAASKRMKKNFSEVGEPLIPVLDHAISKLEQMASDITPKFKFAMEQAAPVTQKFIDGILKGFESFGTAAFKPIMQAWEVFAPVFAGEWDRFMRELGQAFAEMADLVREHPTEIAAALSIVFDILVLLIKTVTFFGQVWASAMQLGLDAAATLMDAWADFVITFVNNMGAIAEGAAIAFGWLPGLGGKIKAANAAFQLWKDETVGKMHGVKLKADELRGTLDRLNRKRKLEADVTQWQGQMAKAKASLKSTMSQEARKRITANINDLQAKVRQAKVELAMLRDKVVNVTVRNLYDSSLNRHRKGGVVGTAATGGVRNNMTLVGEGGPEIVDLAPGSHVRSNSDTRRFLRQGGAGNDQPLLVQFLMDSQVMAEALVDPQRRVVKRHGGVRATFGTL